MLFVVITIFLLVKVYSVGKCLPIMHMTGFLLPATPIIIYQVTFMNVQKFIKHQSHALTYSYIIAIESIYSVAGSASLHLLRVCVSVAVYVYT